MGHRRDAVDPVQHPGTDAVLFTQFPENGTHEGAVLGLLDELLLVTKADSGDGDDDESSDCIPTFAGCITSAEKACGKTYVKSVSYSCNTKTGKVECKFECR